LEQKGEKQRRRRRPGCRKGKGKGITGDPYEQGIQYSYTKITLKP
jgi:hypothetical protein